MREDHFYLGTHRPHWLGELDVPLFVSRRTLAGRDSLPRANAPWCLDSGGFTELSRPPHRWTISVDEYAAEVLRYADTIGRLEWCAPMDYMCEPDIVAGTGLTVREHQRRTVNNFLALREILGDLVIPVVQGWTPADYSECVARYAYEGVDLARERIVGVGSICRRGEDFAISRVVRTLHRHYGFRMHGFGVRGTALAALADVLTSADSMAWSFNARREAALPGCTHKSCQNCKRYALRWRTRTLRTLAQQHLLEVE